MNFPRHNSAGTMAPEHSPARARITARLSHRGGRVALLTILATTALLLLVGPASALAATPSPAFSIRSIAQPTHFAPGDSSGSDVYRVLVTNTGSLPSDGTPITIVDTLPAGVSVQSARLLEWMTREEFGCETAPVQCTFNGVLPAGQALEMDVTVATEPSALGTLTNTATVSGGGVGEASTSAQNPVSPIDAPFAISDFSFGPTGLDGAPDTRAGGHPYALTTSLDFTSRSISGSIQGGGPEVHKALESIKDTIVDLPLGLVGNPQATPKCPLTGLEVEIGSSNVQCPPDTKIGEVTLSEPIGFASSLFPPTEGTFITSVSPLYNLVPEHGHPAEFGFDYAGVVEAHLYPSVVHTDAGYVLRVTTPNTPGVFFPDSSPGFISGFSLTLFGDPRQHANTGAAPFFTNPSDCSASGLTTTIHVDTWTKQGRVNPDGSPDFSDPNWLTASSSLPPATGCNALQFKPTISAQPDTTQADSPTGLNVDLKVPQAPNNDAALATPDLKDATVALPEGMSVNPSSANGLTACSSAQIELNSTEPPACPDASKLGTVEVDTPLIDHPLPGSVYLAKPFENPFNGLLALYIVVDDPQSGVVLKLPGHVEADPQSGRLTTTFAQNPQLPFEDLKVNFFGGPRASLRTPATCGSFTTTSSLTPWSAPDSGPLATPSDSFAISQGANGAACASTEAGLPNKPSFEAGTVTPIAGSYSPFVLKLSREDGSQNLKGIDTTLPPGLTGKLAGIPYCSEAQIAAAGTNSGNAEKQSPSCSLASEVGTVNVGAGAGSSPFYVQGHAYLAGPYKSAPLSLAIVTPAVAGPFDLGTVVVRTALYVNPETAQIRAVSDPIPTILAGIPLDVRSIALNMARPNFTLNPTSCDPMAVLGAATTLPGQTAALSSPFQVGACNALGFKPNVSIHLKGSTKRAGNPALRATVTYPKGSYANIARASVGLPHSEFLDQNHIKTICTRVQFAAEACPPGSIYGHARAFTPLLDKPLEGPVYLRSSSHNLPDLVADLNGQIHVVLDGRIDSVHGGIRNSFEAVPDAPVSKFVLEMQGGKKGLLVNSTNLCASTNRATVKLDAQNGKVHDFNPVVTNSCGGKAKKHGKRHGRGH
jgi:hypothetical protein